MIRWILLSLCFVWPLSVEAAFSAFAGSFDLNTVTGNQSITGTGFQPDIVLFMYPLIAADGNAVDAKWGMGAGISSSSRRAVGMSSQDAQASSVSAAGSSTIRCILIVTNAGGTDSSVDFVSLDSNGFTINVVTAPASARRITYLALGGTDLTNVNVQSISSPTSATTKAFTGTGFQPEALILFTAGAATADPQAPGAANSTPFLGWASSTTNLAVTGTRHVHNVATMDTARRQLTNKCWSHPSATGVIVEASLTSFDSDGFTLDFSTANPSAVFAYAITLRGGRYQSHTFNMSTTTGNTGVTGIGFQPAAVFLHSFHNIAASTTQTHARQGFGWASSTTDRAALAYGDTDNVADAICDQRFDSTKMLTLITEGTPTVNDEFDLASLDSGGYTYNHTTASGVAEEVLGLAFGSTAGEPSIIYTGTGRLFGATIY